MYQEKCVCCNNWHKYILQPYVKSIFVFSDLFFVLYVTGYSPYWDILLNVSFGVLMTIKFWVELGTVFHNMHN